MRDKIITWSLCLLAAMAAPVWGQDTGRTDGPEESEHGCGGNPFGSSIGRAYVSGAFGSGCFDSAGSGQDTGFLYGLDFGYEMHEWIGVQGGYAYLTDRNTSIFSIGSNFSYAWHPFVYNLNVQAGLYAPENGDRNFGIAPGAGIDIVLGEKVRLGLNYKHDYIFTDNTTTEVDRVYAGLKFFF